MKKLIGCVTEEERIEIQNLFERRNGLNELAKILPPDNKDLYDRLVDDIGKNSTQFQAWWVSKSNKYGWESHPEGNWEIDFDTCEIYLVTPDKEPSL